MCILVFKAFLPASPRQLHSMLYRAIIGEPGRNEDDLSHCPPVSGSLEASVVIDLSKRQCTWGTKVVGQPLADVSRTDACWLQPHASLLGYILDECCPAPQVPVTQHSYVHAPVLEVVSREQGCMCYCRMFRGLFLRLFHPATIVRWIAEEQSSMDKHHQ